jgi:hypothetical protein
MTLPIKFRDVPVGSTFKFYFEKHTEWTYKKVSEKEVSCVSCPRTFSSANGKILGILDEEFRSECVLVNG